MSGGKEPSDLKISLHGDEPHVNAFRIAEACELIAAGESVTSAMLDSGFNTESNFNREFQRIMNTSPSAWRALHEGYGGQTVELIATSSPPT